MRSSASVMVLRRAQGGEGGEEAQATT